MSIFYFSMASLPLKSIIGNVREFLPSLAPSIPIWYCMTDRMCKNSFRILWPLLVKVKEKKTYLFIILFLSVKAWNQMCFWLTTIFYSYNILTVLLKILELLNRNVLKFYMWSSEPLAIDLYQIKVYFLYVIIFHV